LIQYSNISLIRSDPLSRQKVVLIVIVVARPNNIKKNCFGMRLIGFDYSSNIV